MSVIQITGDQKQSHGGFWCSILTVTSFTRPISVIQVSSFSSSPLMQTFFWLVAPHKLKVWTTGGLSCCCLGLLTHLWFINFKIQVTFFSSYFIHKLGRPRMNKLNKSTLISDLNISCSVNKTHKEQKWSILTHDTTCWVISCFVLIPGTLF